MRILVVEDDAALCSAIRFHLEREGYEADECQDGESALHLIRQQAYDLIILDRMLPSLGGIEVLTQLRHEGISCHVLIVTALGGVNERTIISSSPSPPRSCSPGCARCCGARRSSKR